MDAQQGRDYRCQQHLHGDRHPANEQPDRNPTGNRASVQMPNGRLSEGISHPSAERIRRWTTTTYLVVQFTAELRRIRQMFFQPVSGHSLTIAIKKKGAQYNNVEKTKILSFSRLIEKRVTVVYT